jgi:hypothetical protein
VCERPLQIPEDDVCRLRMIVLPAVLEAALRSSVDKDVGPETHEYKEPLLSGAMDSSAIYR